MNETNSSAKHYDTVVIGSRAARTSRRDSSRQIRQKDCGGRKLYCSWEGPVSTGTIPSKTLQEAVLRSTRSGSTDRRISASNLAQRIEEVASNPVRVFEIRLRLDDGNARVETAALQKRFRPRLMAKKNLLDFQPEDFDPFDARSSKKNT
jgi:NAD(P) transhydrogenase